MFLYRHYFDFINFTTRRLSGELHFKFIHTQFGGIPLILVRAVYDNQMELQTLVAAFSFSNGSLL